MPCMVQFDKGTKPPYNFIYINAKTIQSVVVNLGHPDQTVITFGNNDHVVVHENCADVVDRLRRIFENDGA